MVQVKDNNHLEAFLSELSKLSDRYGIQIAGCGCCGSPYLLHLDGTMFTLVAEELEFNRESKTYSIHNPSDNSGFEYDGIMYLADGTLLTNEKLEEILKDDLGEEVDINMYSSAKPEEVE